MSTTAAFTPEQIEHYYEVMPDLAAAHATEGPFSLLETNPAEFPAQDPANNYLEAERLHRARKSLSELALMASFLVPNTEPLIEEATETLEPLIDEISTQKFDHGKNVLFVGNHPSVDSIIHPELIVASAARHLCRANDDPQKRTIIVAKQLAWYGYAGVPGLELVRHFSKIAMTAPGTIGGKKLDAAVREYINADSVGNLEEDLATGEQEVTFAFGGQTDRVLNKPFGGRKKQFRLQYSASPGTKELLARPDVVVVPFATYQDPVSKHMKIALAEPRPVVDTDEAEDVGYEIAALAERISGMRTVQVPNKLEFAHMVEAKDFNAMFDVYRKNRVKQEPHHKNSTRKVYELGMTSD